MKLVLHNLTYHDCPVEVREKVTFTFEQRQALLKTMHRTPEVAEAMILQTCNRLEIYLYAARDFDSGVFVRELLGMQSAEAAGAWAEHSHQMTDTDVVRHLFEVAAGLDSQMVGENQILLQVKAAYTESIDTRMSRLVFHKLLHQAFRVGKAVRTQTDICSGAVSIGQAAVELAREKVDLAQAQALILGAGENADLVARYLLEAELGQSTIANRDIEKAQAMAERFERGEAIGLVEVPQRLADVDVLIASTAAPEPILIWESVEWVLAARSKPLLIVDIAVPRDVDPAVGQLDCVTLYNIDDLDEQVNANRRKRSREIPQARAIIEEFVAQFLQWYESLDLVPVIARLTQAGMEMARAEARRYAKDFGDENNGKLQAFAKSLVRKILHGPIQFIKNGGNEPSVEQLEAVELVNKMFLLQDKGNE